MKSILLYSLLSFLPLSSYPQTGSQAKVTIEVTDSLQSPLPYTTVGLRSTATGVVTAASTDLRGYCSFALPAGDYHTTISHIGYKSSTTHITLLTGSKQHYSQILYANTVAIGDVVVTASESRGITSASHIGRDAMAHLQPSSFEDLLELLPGGRALDPAFGSSNHIRLREVPSSDSDYATSSLGVSYLMDGIPLSNDAALQYQATTGITDRISLNRGIDMRTLSTDEIASVEIIRGIASVEYGDLTSGLVKIKRKEGGRNLEARFKADLKSTLVYVGKGFEWGERVDRLTMNIGVNWLDARADPRNTRQNYSRLTGSWRINKQWETATPYRWKLGGSLDYTGSFDRVKSDLNIDNGPTGRPIEHYSAGYNKLAAALNFSVSAKEQTLFERFEFSASISSEFDRIDRWRYVVLGGSYPILGVVEQGSYDAQILSTRYEATLRVDGKPFYAFAKTQALFRADTPLTHHRLRVGAEWNMSKNYGRGLIYDPTRPLSAGMSTRPRHYDALAALHRLSGFAEGNTTLDAGGWRVEAMAGLRISTMVNLGNRYALQGRIYLDPRLNLAVSLPAFTLAGESMHITLAGGVGWHTKTPTLDQLYPEPIYSDFTQLNYFPADEALRRINMVVYKSDPTNYALRAARNLKWELRGDVRWLGSSLSITYFRENMTSGFRTATRVRTYSYRDYDESSIDNSTLTGPPSLDALPYTTQTVLGRLAYTSNGSRTFKQGVEFTLSTARIQALATKLTVSGAWFRTRYQNSEPQYIATSVAIGNRPYPYIGLYEQEDNYVYEVCNTNFLLDTQIPRLGLIFSTSFQCQWFSGSQTQRVDPHPISYLDTQLREHLFDKQAAADGILQHMIRPQSEGAYLYRQTPFSMYVNLKISKRLYRNKFNVALFVNRLFAYSPSYINELGSLTRRYVSPYFGMELNVNL